MFAKLTIPLLALVGTLGLASEPPGTQLGHPGYFGGYGYQGHGFSGYGHAYGQRRWSLPNTTQRPGSFYGPLWWEH